MKAFEEHLIFFMDKLDYPEAAKEKFIEVNEAFKKNDDQKQRMLDIVSEFDENPGEENIQDILDRLSLLAEDMGESKYTLHLLFHMYASLRLMNRYVYRGIDLDIYWDSMADLKYKLMECKEVYDIWGSFVAYWFAWFFSLERFALGRLQYEHKPYERDDYSKAGYTIKKGDLVYNTHIPSSGPLTKESVFDSMKKAYEFYKDELKDGIMPIVCYTWLIYPDNRKFFPETSNILSFMDLFDVIEVKDDEKQTPSWRIFGKDYEKPIHELPRDTALQRAYVDWFLDGGITGDGFGVILFDGEKVINK